MTKLEILQKEARERLIDAFPTSPVTYGDRDLFLSKVLEEFVGIYSRAIEDAKGAWPEEQLLLHSVEKWNDFNRGWNAAREKALKNLDELMPGV